MNQAAPNSDECYKHPYLDLKPEDFYQLALAFARGQVVDPSTSQGSGNISKDAHTTDFKDFSIRGKSISSQQDSIAIAVNHSRGMREGVPEESVTLVISDGWTKFLRIECHFDQGSDTPLLISTRPDSKSQEDWVKDANETPQEFASRLASAPNGNKRAAKFVEDYLAAYYRETPLDIEA